MNIGILGDYNPAFPSHPATNEALHHAAAAVGLEVSIEWLPTPSLDDSLLERQDALVAAPGSPYRDMERMLAAIEFARRRDWPFTGA